jgi:RNA polymerase sigma-70 factor (ECF subfamily)
MGVSSGGLRNAGAMLDRLSDEELMARFLAGELPAFEVLLVRHRRGIYQFIYRFVGTPTQAEDIMQDVFTRLFTAADSFERRSRFTTWIYTIARNLCIDFLRKRKHRNAASLDQPKNPQDESESTLIEHLRCDARDPEDEAHGRELRAVILRALEAISPEQREVFLLREEAGLPFEEIARIVDAPLNTVKSRMRYALQNLRATLSAQGVDPSG